MRDRLPAPGKENRVKITLDDGRTVEGVLSFADDATQEGSAYTKGNVLPDDVCDTLGIDRVQSEPKDAFLAIGNVATMPSGYATDFWKYLNFEHPVLNAYYVKPGGFEIGTYSGNSENSQQIKTKGFPVAVLVISTELENASSTYYPSKNFALATRRYPSKDNDSHVLEINQNGFKVYGNDKLNSGTFNYIAFM